MLPGCLAVSATQSNFPRIGDPESHASKSAPGHCKRIQTSRTSKPGRRHETTCTKYQSECTSSGGITNDGLVELVLCPICADIGPV
jgi:hypothetical protein